MPCTYYTPEEEARRARAHIEDKNREIETLHEHIDQLTRMLCDVLGSYDTEMYLVDILESNEELSLWWIDHQRRDAKRQRRLEAASKRAAEEKVKKKAAEKTKKKALSKLTEEEKALLGL